MDEIMRTVIPEGSGFGGGSALALGAGAIGGLVLGSLWGGNGFGNWGNRGGAVAGDVGYNSGMLTGIQQQLTDMNTSNLAQSVASADRDFLIQTSTQNQYLGGAINGVENAVQNNTLNQTQNSGATNLNICQGFNSVNKSILEQGYQNQLAVVQQNGENRLQAQQLANQQQQCCCQVLKAISDEGCANRELQREIQYQNTRDELAQTRAQLAASTAQQNLTAQLTVLAGQFAQSQQAQTQAIINALKPATTAGA